MDLLDPKNDVVFKMLLARERNRGVLRDFLTAVLSPAEPIEVIEVLNPELPKDHLDDKGLVLDLRVRLGGGEWVNVEMQRADTKAVHARVAAYLAKMYVGQLEAGDDYTKLDKAVTILLSDFESFAQPHAFHETFVLRSRPSGVVLTDRMRVDVLSLRKLGWAEDAGLEEAVVRWGMFFASGGDPEVLGRLSMRDPQIGKAKEALEVLSRDREARELAFRKRADDYFYVRSLIEAKEEGEAKGRAEGEAKGRAEGEAKGRAETILRLLTLRGIAPSEVQRARILACADLVQLDRWLERAIAVTKIEELFE